MPANRRRGGAPGSRFPGAVDPFEHEPAEDEVLPSVGELRPEARRRPPAQRQLDAVAGRLAGVVVIEPQHAGADRHDHVQQARAVGATSSRSRAGSINPRTPKLTRRHCWGA